MLLYKKQTSCTSLDVDIEHDLPYFLPAAGSTTMFQVKDAVKSAKFIQQQLFPKILS